MLRWITLNLLAALAVMPLESLSADEGLVSKINGRAVEMPGPGESYSFWIIGHFYGEPESFSICPTGTLLSNLDLINSSDARMLVTMGDIVKIPTKQRLDNFRKVARQIELPMFNAPGNHELLDSLHLFSRDDYIRSFGPTWQAFSLGCARFILLDTSLNPGEIAGEQLEFLSRELKAAAQDPTIRVVLIFSHFLIWCADDPRLEVVWEHIVPIRHNYKRGVFSQKVEPLLIEAAAHKPLYWFSGDNGPSWSYSPFYWKMPDRDITYVASGLGGTERDEILLAKVSPSGAVSLTPVSMVGAELGPMEMYGPEYWEKVVAQEAAADPPPQAEPRWVEVLRNKRFWAGIIVAAPFGFILGFALGRRRPI